MQGYSLEILTWLCPPVIKLLPRQSSPSCPPLHSFQVHPSPAAAACRCLPSLLIPFPRDSVEACCTPAFLLPLAPSQPSFLAQPYSFVSAICGEAWSWYLGYSSILLPPYCEVGSLNQTQSSQIWLVLLAGSYHWSGLRLLSVELQASWHAYLAFSWMLGIKILVLLLLC